ARHAWSCGVSERNSAITAGELRAVPRLRKDGHLLEQRHKVRMVRLLRPGADRADRHGDLPGGRTPDLRTKSRGADRRVLPRDVRAQLLRAEAGPADAVRDDDRDREL